MLCAAEDTDPRGQNSPPPGFRPRSRDHFGDTPWLPPGGPRSDSEVSTPALPGWARDPGSPGGRGDPDPRSSLQDGRDCWSFVGTRPRRSRCGDLGFPRGKGGSGSYLEQTAGFLRVTRAVSSSRSSAACALEPLPALLAPSGAVQAGRRALWTRPHSGRSPPAPASTVPRTGDTKSFSTR